MALNCVTDIGTEGNESSMRFSLADTHFLNPLNDCMNSSLGHANTATASICILLGPTVIWFGKKTTVPMIVVCQSNAASLTLS